MIEEVPKKAVVVASTSQVISGSDLSREKVEHAFKLLGVCNTRFTKGHKPSNHIRARIKSHVYTTE